MVLNVFMKKEAIIRVIFWVTLLLLIGFEIYSLSTDSHYKYDFVFLVLLLGGVYLLRDKIKLHPLHYFLFALFLILHNFGTFGVYENYYFGIEYDYYVHGFFGFVASLILFRAYNLVGPYKGKFMFVAIIAVVLGFSAFHEIAEFLGAIIWGQGEGFLLVGPGDTGNWDAQIDMVNNLVGGLIGLSVYWVKKKFVRKK